MNILTEEEINDTAKKIAVQIGLDEIFLLDKVIKSYRNLLSANAELSFKKESHKNKELKLLKAMREIIAITVSESILDIAESVILEITKSALEELK